MSSPNHENLNNKSRKPRYIRSHNRRLILSLFYENGILPVSELVARTGLSKTTIMKIINDFIEEELICSAGKGDSTEEGGKRPELYTYRDDRASLLVMYNGWLTLTDLHGKPLERHQVIPDFHKKTYEDVIALLSDSILRLMWKWHLKPEHLAGIVLAIAGIVDSEQGMVCHAVHSQAWPDQRPIVRDLREALSLDIPVYLENDAAFFGFAELLDPGNRSVSSIVTISAGIHTGGCVLRDHALIHGSSGFVGEFGHTTVDPHNGIQCICGGHGCFEVMVNPERLLASAPSPVAEKSAAGQSGHVNHQIIQVFDKANQGDPQACRIVDEAVYWFAILIRGIIVQNDPQLIIIQGTYQQAGRYFIDQLHQAVYSSPLFKARSNLEIRYSGLNRDRDFLRGAAYYVYRRQLT